MSLSSRTPKQGEAEHEPTFHETEDHHTGASANPPAKQIVEVKLDTPPSSSTAVSDAKRSPEVVVPVKSAVEEGNKPKSSQPSSANGHAHDEEPTYGEDSRAVLLTAVGSPNSISSKSTKRARAQKRQKACAEFAKMLGAGAAGFATVAIPTVFGWNPALSVGWIKSAVEFLSEGTFGIGRIIPYIIGGGTSLFADWGLNCFKTNRPADMSRCRYAFTRVVFPLIATAATAQFIYERFVQPPVQDQQWEGPESNPQVWDQVVQAVWQAPAVYALKRIGHGIASKVASTECYQNLPSLKGCFSAMFSRCPSKCREKDSETAALRETLMGGGPKA